MTTTPTPTLPPPNERLEDFERRHECASCGKVEIEQLVRKVILGDDGSEHRAPDLLDEHGAPRAHHPPGWLRVGVHVGGSPVRTMSTPAKALVLSLAERLGKTSAKDSAAIAEQLEHLSMVLERLATDGYHLLGAEERHEEPVCSPACARAWLRAKADGTLPLPVGDGAKEEETTP